MVELRKFFQLVNHRAYSNKAKQLVQVRLRNFPMVFVSFVVRFLFLLNLFSRVRFFSLLCVVSFMLSLLPFPSPFRLLTCSLLSLHPSFAAFFFRSFPGAQEYDQLRQGMLGWDEFSTMYQNCVYDERIGKEFFAYCSDKKRVTFRELQNFLQKEQNEPRASDSQYVASMVWDYVNMAGDHRDPRQPSMTLQEVSLFLGLFRKKYVVTPLLCCNFLPWLILCCVFTSLLL